jgi:hypothetical protein
MSFFFFLPPSYVIADAVAYAVQYHSHDVELCRNMTLAAAASSAAELPAALRGAELSAALSAAVRGVLARTGVPCRQWDLRQFDAPAIGGPAANMRQWMWQSCSAFGFFQVAPVTGCVRGFVLMNAGLMMNA